MFGSSSPTNIVTTGPGATARMRPEIKALSVVITSTSLAIMLPSAWNVPTTETIAFAGKLARV